jgi:hypothetical protein
VDGGGESVVREMGRGGYVCSCGFGGFLFAGAGLRFYVCTNFIALILDISL